MSILKKILLGISIITISIASVGCTQASNISPTSIQDTHKKEAAYSSKIFDTSYVHTIDIEFSETDLQDLLENATDETFYSCSVTIDGETFDNVGVRTKGNSSLSQVASSDSDRYSFKINFGKYDKEQDYYGLDKMALNNNMADATMMKDYITYTMMSDFGVAAPQVSFSYVTINGQEWGLYLNVEDLDESFLERNYGEDYGDLYKPETNDMDMKNMGQGEAGNPPNFKDGKPEFPNNNQISDTNTEASRTPTLPEQEMSKEQMEKMTNKFQEKGKGMFGNGEALGADLVYTDDEISSYSNIFDQAETDVTPQDEQNLIAALKQLSEGTHLDDVIDIDATLRYFVVHNFVDNYDSYTGSMLHNYYLYQDTDGKLSMLPWDYNLAFGAFGGMGKGNMPVPQKPTDDNGNMQIPQMPDTTTNATSMVNMAIDTPLSGTTEEDRPMWTQLINNYKEKYHELFDEFISTTIENGSILEEIERVRELIAPYVQKDPTAFYTYDEFNTAVETLKQFITLREKSIRGQLEGSIPSTTAEQNAQPDTLIDASSINISDMGSQGGMLDNHKKQFMNKE